MTKEYSYAELKESRLIYDRKPPAFGVIITFMTLVFITAAILWAALSVKTYVVKANGLAAGENKVNLMNRVSGAIERINAGEGDTVKKGDVIIELNSFQTRLQIAQIQANVDFYAAKTGAAERLIKFIDAFTLADEATRANPFDKDDTAEMKAYSDAQTLIDYIRGQESAAANEQPARDYTQDEADSLKTQFASQQYAGLDEYASQLVQQQSQLKMYTESLAEYEVVAEQDGIVHLTAGITSGTMIQAGSLLGSISSGEALLFDAVISAADRAKIAVGDGAEIAVSGVLQAEYGVLKGRVIAIDFDSTQTEDGGVFYRVKIKPEGTRLTDKKGGAIEIKTGMIAESRILYDETTWLKWVIEQIGIKF